MPDEKNPDPNGGEASPSEGEAAASDGRAEGSAMPAATFESFVQAMAGQVLINLGYAKNPATGKRELSLDEAKYSIDLLQILKEKTKGNLADRESRLLDGALYDLRMRYINAMR